MPTFTKNKNTFISPLKNFVIKPNNMHCNCALDLFIVCWMIYLHTNTTSSCTSHFLHTSFLIVSSPLNIPGVSSHPLQTHLPTQTGLWPGHNKYCKNCCTLLIENPRYNTVHLHQSTSKQEILAPSGIVMSTKTKVLIPHVATTWVI